MKGDTAMIEQEAKKRWCPMNRYEPMPFNWVRYFFGYTSWINSRGDKTGASCVSSDCMMWREMDKVEDPVKSGNYIPTGYCGLGGKP